MDEIERRLRSALMAAAEPAPADLLASIYRRHRRHQRRARAGYLAMAAALALAVPSVGHELLGGRPSGAPRAGTTVSPGVSPAAGAAPGTILRTCNDANWGQLESNWRAGSLKAGPLWFVAGRYDGYVHYGTNRPHGHVTLNYGHSGGVMIVEVANGSTVTMKPVPAARSYFQFFDGFNGPEPNQLPAGDTGFTFRACPRPDTGPNGRVTDFYLGFSIKAGHAAPVDIWSRPSARPIRVIFTA
jgi:hypothetical protein